MGVDYSYEDRCTIPVNQELQSLIEKYVRNNCGSYVDVQGEEKKKRKEGKKWNSLRNAFVVNGTCKEVISKLVKGIKEFEGEQEKQSDDDNEESVEEEERNVSKERKKKLFMVDKNVEEIKINECKGKSCVNYNCNYNHDWDCSYKGNEHNYGKSVCQGNVNRSYGIKKFDCDEYDMESSSKEFNDDNDDDEGNENIKEYNKYNHYNRYTHNKDTNQLKNKVGHKYNDYDKEDEDEEKNGNDKYNNVQYKQFNNSMNDNSSSNNISVNDNYSNEIESNEDDDDEDCDDDNNDDCDSNKFNIQYNPNINRVNTSNHSNKIVNIFNQSNISNNEEEEEEEKSETDEYFMQPPTLFSKPIINPTTASKPSTNLVLPTKSQPNNHIPQPKQTFLPKPTSTSSYSILNNPTKPTKPKPSAKANFHAIITNKNPPNIDDGIFQETMDYFYLKSNPSHPHTNPSKRSCNLCTKSPKLRPKWKMPKHN